MTVTGARPPVGHGSAPPPLVLHATAVALDGRALLILGPSGSGKSALALDLLARGAALIADDRTEVVLLDGAPVARCPPALAGRIEARGLGLLRLPPAPPAPVVLAVDLAAPPAARLPPDLHLDLMGRKVRLLCGRGIPHLGPALLLCLRGATLEDPDTPV